MHAGTRQTFLIPNGEPNSVVSALKNHNVAAMNGTYLFVYCVLFDFFWQSFCKDCYLMIYGFFYDGITASTEEGKQV